MEYILLWSAPSSGEESFRGDESLAAQPDWGYRVTETDEVFIIFFFIKNSSLFILEIFFTL